MQLNIGLLSLSFFIFSSVMGVDLTTGLNNLTNNFDTLTGSLAPKNEDDKFPEDQHANYSIRAMLDQQMLDSFSYVQRISIDAVKTLIGVANLETINAYVMQDKYKNGMELYSFTATGKQYKEKLDSFSNNVKQFNLTYKDASDNYETSKKSVYEPYVVSLNYNYSDDFSKAAKAAFGKNTGSSSNQIIPIKNFTLRVSSDADEKKVLQITKDTIEKLDTDKKDLVVKVIGIYRDNALIERLQLKK